MKPEEYEFEQCEQCGCGITPKEYDENDGFCDDCEWNHTMDQLDFWDDWYFE